MTITIMTILGARPQFIKAATVSRLLAQRSDVRELIVHTGQHFEDSMSSVFFSELGLPTPHRNLGIAGGTHGAMTGRMLEAIELAMLEDRPDVVLVYGDTNSTLAGALAAGKLSLPIVHVEAGLRSYNRKMPEEINRILTDRLSTLLLAPTLAAVRNLASEGILKHVVHVGDVMADAALHAAASGHGATALSGLTMDAPFALATVHRAENVDDDERLARVFTFLEEEARLRPVLLPVHPRLARRIAERGLSPAGVQLLQPQGYFAMQRLLAACELVLTDSGGVQKEAYFHRKPCITLRDETEWVETIEAGWNRLWTSADWRIPRSFIADYGTGDAAAKCVSAILELCMSSSSGA